MVDLMGIAPMSLGGSCDGVGITVIIGDFVDGRVACEIGGGSEMRMMIDKQYYHHFQENKVKEQRCCCHC